jgi:predicted SnoaL-like aldol condensation-catalyzing enzyme
MTTAEARKKTAVEFLRQAAAGHARRAAEGVFKPGGVHHNVYFAAGWKPLLEAMDQAAKEAPHSRLEVKHVLCDGDLVAVHSHVVHRKGEPGFAAIHMFRFEGERIAEMWDVGLAIPPDSPNKDGAF